MLLVTISLSGFLYERCCRHVHKTNQQPLDRFRSLVSATSSFWYKDCDACLFPNAGWWACIVRVLFVQVFVVAANVLKCCCRCCYWGCLMMGSRHLLSISCLVGKASLGDQCEPPAVVTRSVGPPCCLKVLHARGSKHGSVTIESWDGI